MTSSSSRTRKQTSRKHSAPVRLRGYPRTAVPAMDRITTTSAEIVEATDTQSAGPQISNEQEAAETVESVSTETLSLASLSEYYVVEENLEPQIQRSNKSNCDDDNEELDIDFEAVMVKSERFEDVPENSEDVQESTEEYLPVLHSSSSHLKVVYLCPVQKCSHHCLERHVFLEHMETVHETQKGLVCKYCNLNLGYLSNLVIHMEENHQDDDRTRAVKPVTKSVKNWLSGTKDRSAPKSNQIKSNRSSFASRLSTQLPIIDDEDWLPGETEREYELTSIDAMIKRVLLTFHLSSCDSNPGDLEKQLQDWRANKVNYNPPDISDPVQLINTLKAAEALSAISTPLKLKHLYKCNGNNCCFTSDVEGEFREHLIQKTCMFNTASYCIYCGESHKSVQDLASHITIKHGQCIFQCPHCIFRAKKVIYVLIHLAFMHEGQGEKVKVQKCLLSKGANIEDDVPELFTIIHPVSCINDCNFVSLDTATFLEHHSSAHSHMAYVICFLCSAGVSREHFESHLKFHRVFENHCEICGYGSDSFIEVVLHNCFLHPERNGRIFLRKQNFLPTPKGELKAPLPPNNSIIPVQDIEEKAALAKSLSSTTVVLSGNAVLKKCGFQQCQYTTSDISELSNHMDTCSITQEMSRLYCSQCYCSYGTKRELIEHLNVHVESQIYYFCGVCNFRTSLTSTIKAHLEMIHKLQFKQTNCVARPRDGVSISDWVFNPLPGKTAISKSTTGILKSSISSNLRSSAADKNGTNLTKRKVSARDRSNSPSKMIIDKKISSSECDTGLEVRKNLIMHLDPHLKPPESVRNFNDSNKDIWRPEKIPQFVPISERFICPFIDCTHRSATSASLDIHVSLVHENPSSILCAHCPKVVNSLANLHYHLGLHGPLLYKCSHCRYINSHWNIVRSHSMIEHVGIWPEVLELRNIKEKVSNTNLSAEYTDGEMRCPCCPNFRCHSVMVLRKHLTDNLSLIKYKCNLCRKSFAKSADLQVHFVKHDGRKEYTGIITKVCEEFITKTIISETIKRNSMFTRRNAKRKKKKKKISSEETVSTAISDDSRYHCPSCPFSCASEYQLMLARHIRTLHLKILPQFICGYCNKTFEGEYTANQHHSAAHSLIMERKVVEKKDATTERFLEWLMPLLRNIDGGEQVHRPIPLICEVDGCQEAFTNVNILKTHFFNHNTSPSKIGGQSLNAVKECQRIYKLAKPSPSLPSCVMCPFCNYVSDRNMKRHIYNHYDFRFFKCSYCDYDSKIDAIVKSHIISEHPTNAPVLIELKKPKDVIIEASGLADKLYGLTLNFARVTVAEDEPQEKPEEELEVFTCTVCSYLSTSVVNIRYHCQNEHDMAVAIIIGKRTNVKNKLQKAAATPLLAGYSRGRKPDSSGTTRDKSESFDATAGANQQGDESKLSSKCSHRSIKKSVKSKDRERPPEVRDRLRLRKRRISDESEESKPNPRLKINLFKFKSRIKMDHLK